MLRFAPLVFLAVLALCAAWTWPVAGPVVQGFSFESARPYAAGQHRGIDIGAAPGAAVRAPPGGGVALAGPVPGSGRSVTIETPDGLALTLTHLGPIHVARNASL